MQSNNTQLVHFKNGIFHGTILPDGRRQGQSICLYDNGAIFIGPFKSQQPNGKCFIMLSPDTYFIGSLKKGMLDGSFTVRSPHFHIYSQTIMNRIQGEVVVIDRQHKRARVWEIQNSQGICIREAQYDEFLTEDKILRAVAPYAQYFPQLQQYFLLNKQDTPLTIKTVRGKDSTQIFMKDNSNRKLVVQFQRERLMTAGIFEGGILQGIGYLFDRNQGIQIEGEIYNGVLDGEGMKKDLHTGRSVFGKFVKGDIRSLESMDNKAESLENNLIALKKRIHLHALDFTNDYLNERPIYLLRNFYETIAENETTYDQFLKQTKGDKGLQKQPSRMGLNRQPSTQELAYNINEYNMIKNALAARR